MEGNTIWGIVATVIGSIFAIITPIIKAKAGKYIGLLDMIIRAFDDDKVTTEEFNAIIAHAKTILKK